MSRRVTGPQPGQSITSRFLTSVAQNQNELLDKVTLPRDIAETSRRTGENVQKNRGFRGPDGTGGAAGPVAGVGADAQGLAFHEVWREHSRITSTVRIESASDSAVFVNVERIDQLVLNRGDGGRVYLILEHD